MIFFSKSLIFGFSFVSSFGAAYLLMRGSQEIVDSYIISYVNENINDVDESDYFCKYGNVIDEKCIIKKFNSDKAKCISDETENLNTFKGLKDKAKYKLETSRNVFSNLNLNNLANAEFEVYSKKNTAKKLGKFKFEYKGNKNNFEGKTNLFLTTAFERFEEGNATSQEYKCKGKSVDDSTMEVCEIFKFTKNQPEKQMNSSNWQISNMSFENIQKTTSNEDTKIKNYYIIKMAQEVSISKFLNNTHIMITFKEAGDASVKHKSFASFLIESAITNKSEFDTNKENTMLLTQIKCTD